MGIDHETVAGPRQPQNWNSFHGNNALQTTMDLWKTPLTITHYFREQALSMRLFHPPPPQNVLFRQSPPCPVPLLLNCLYVLLTVLRFLFLLGRIQIKAIKMQPFGRETLCGAVVWRAGLEVANCLAIPAAWRYVGTLLYFSCWNISRTIGWTAR